MSDLMKDSLRWAYLLVVGSCGMIPYSADAQATDTGEGAPARLAVLLDTSVEMGFLVPQVRKEVKDLNAHLTQINRPPVLLREFEGASLDHETSTAVGARRNLFYALKDLYEDSAIDSVYWLTALRGVQSGEGFFALQALLQAPVENRPQRRLIIRNIWQDQIQAGDAWVRNEPELELDPLNLLNRPTEWYGLVADDRGVIIRSWQTPPPSHHPQFGFPFRIAHSSYLHKLGYPSGEAFFDQKWAQVISQVHGLKFFGQKEQWLPRAPGRRWISETTLVPFVSDETRSLRSTTVFESLSARESIEEDLIRIKAKKIGVVFAFGYVKTDMRRHLALKNRPPRDWRMAYLADLAKIVGETQQHRKLFQDGIRDPDQPQRVYASEFIDLDKMQQQRKGPDPYAARMAKLVRDEDIDAIYFFTNGYTGGGDYGTYGVDEQLIALAIKEAGVRLYVRMPFEFGPTPISLQRLALASGGGVFLGKVGDEDWNAPTPTPAWPEPTTVEVK